MQIMKNSNGNDIRRIMESSLFCGLAEELIEKYVIPFGHIESFEKNEQVLSPAQPTNGVGVILTGTVHIENLFSDGSYSLMSVLSFPKVLGSDLIFTKTKRPPYYAVCASPVSIFFFPEDLFAEQGNMPEDLRQDILNRLATIVSQENMQKYYRIAILSQKGLRERILTYLRMQGQKRGTNTFEIPFSRDEMAAFLCVNRSALSHELRLLEQDGLIHFRKNRFILTEKN